MIALPARAVLPVAAGVALLLGVLWVTRRPSPPGTPVAAQVGSAVAAGIIDGASGAAAGAVVAAGQVVGIPATDAGRCAAARLAGDAWAVSLYCPAPVAVAAGLDGIAGAVVAAGQVVGIPATAPDKCAAAKTRGSKWDASLYCTAGDFIRWLAAP